MMVHHGQTKFFSCHENVFCTLAAKADQDRREREKRLKAEARNSHGTNHSDPVERIQESKSADDVKRSEEMKRAEELKRKAEADLAAAAKAKAKLNAETAKQGELKASNQRADDKARAAKEESSERLRVKLKSLESKEIIEAALLGALEPEDSGGISKQGYDDSQSGTQIEQPTRDDLASSTRLDKSKTTQRKPRLPQYDVIFMKDQNSDIDVPQLLEGSLKDLLKDGSTPTRKSSSGDLNY